MLSVNAVSCEKQGRILFDNLQLSLTGGQLLYVHGPNGAGKSTLLRMIAGLEMPQRGDVSWQLDNGSERHPVGSDDVIYIGHKTALNPSLSAVQNLSFWCALNNIIAPNNIYPLLATLGLVGLEDVPIKQLSAGQQQRIALARLWLKDASMWILDEPFTALDQQAIGLITAKIEQYITAGNLVIMTSHQPIDIACAYTSIALEYNL